MEPKPGAMTARKPKSFSPDRVLPGRAAAEVLARQQDGGVAEGFAVQHELRVLLPGGDVPIAPVGEQALAQPLLGHTLHLPARDDGVGVDVDAQQRCGDAAVVHEWFHFRLPPARIRARRRCGRRWPRRPRWWDWRDATGCPAPGGSRSCGWCW